MPEDKKEEDKRKVRPERFFEDDVANAFKIISEGKEEEKEVES